MDTRIILLYAMLYLLNKGGNCQSCVPGAPAIPVTEVNPGKQAAIRCTIIDLTCRNNIIAMKWQKKPENTGDWKEAYILYPDGTETHKNIDDGYGGYTLAGRTNPRVFEGDYDLNINNTTLADSGQWRCVYWSDSEESESSVGSLEVTGQCSISLQKSGNSEYVINSTYSYTCSCPETYPEIDKVTWVTGNSEQVENATTLLKGYVWDVRSIISYRASDYDQVPVSCKIEKVSGGVPWISEDKYEPTEILTPAFIESSTNGKILISTDKTLELLCVASGSDVEIKWTRNSIEFEFPNNLFTNNEVRIDGNFSFGQPLALESKLTWKPPPSASSALCKDKLKHEGEYQCEAEARGSSHDMSKDTEVEFVHTNGCISDVGLAFIIIGSLLAVAIAIGVIYYFCCRPPGCRPPGKGSSGAVNNDVHQSYGHTAEKNTTRTQSQNDEVIKDRKKKSTANSKGGASVNSEQDQKTPKGQC